MELFAVAGSCANRDLANSILDVFPIPNFETAIRAMTLGRGELHLRLRSAFVPTGWAFFFSSAIAGQIIFHERGDTSAISFGYGLLYILYAGSPGSIRREYPFFISLPCQFIAAGFFYWIGRKHTRIAWVSAGLLTVAACLWLVVMSPRLFQ